MVEQNEKIKQEKASKILELFDFYNDTKSCGFITDYALRQIQHIPKWDENLIRKIKCIKNFVSMIQLDVNSKYSKTIFSKFSISNNLFFYADPSMPQIFTKMRILQNSNNNIIPLSLNIPLNKLISMPALEVYTLLNASVHSSIKAMMSGKQHVEQNIDLNKNTEQSVDDIIEKQEDKIYIEENKKEAHALLAAYLEDFLSKTCKDQLNEFDDVASLIAAQIINELPPEEVEKMLSVFFDMSTYDAEAIEKLEVFGVDARIDKLYNNAQELWKNPNKEPEALNATQQYEALMSLQLQGEFTSLVKSQEKGLEGSVNIQQFCKNYADTFMESNGLNPIKLTFKNEGSLGTYIDQGDSQRININLSAIKSVAELVSTLSHELTHAVESSINKGKGEGTEEGFGLRDNISNNISQSSLPKNSKAYQFLVEVNRYCYRINPNERSARYGELSALKFMQSLATTDKSRSQLVSTIESFRTYQTQSRDVLQKLSNEDFVADLKRRADEILSSDIPEADKEMIRERMDYIDKIRKRKSGLDHSMESESLSEIAKFAAKEIELQEIDNVLGM